MTSWENAERRPYPFEIRPKPFDVVIALGENYRLGWNKTRLINDPRHLSTDSKMVATAAVMHYLDGTAPEIIFSTGHTSGDDFPSEAKAMKDYAIRKFGDRIPHTAMKIEQVSKDTSGNAEEIGKIIASNPYYDRVALLAPSIHKRRAMGIFGAWGIHVMRFLPAEEKLRERSLHHFRYVSKLELSLRWLAENVKELLLNAERYLLFDPKALLLRKITQRTRR